VGRERFIKQYFILKKSGVLHFWGWRCPYLKGCLTLLGVEMALLKGVFYTFGGGDALTLLYELEELFKVSLFISHGQKKI
jgi:hypothetical protein